MRKNKETKVVCPKCGAQFAIADKTHVATGVVIGKNAGLGTVHPEVVGESKPQAEAFPSKALDRIEALRRAGVDVSSYFAMCGSNGGDFVGRNENGKFVVVDDNDPIYDAIRQGGDVYNSKLARRWVMAQMFHMLAREEGHDFSQYYYKKSITDQIRQKGYDYMWKQMEDELYAQMKMYHHDDMENLNDRSRWFNNSVLAAMIEDYRYQLHLHVKHNVKKQKCKGVPYKRICGENVFVDDIQKKVFEPIERLTKEANEAKSPSALYAVCREFNKIRKTRSWQPRQSAAWLDAYKGAGAFFTMQNMIRYHGCRFLDDFGNRMSKDASYTELEAKAREYKNEGWRMIGLLRQFLKDNHIDINAKMAEWRNK